MSEFETDAERGRGTVYPPDCDHMGHMNVATYVRKFDESTWALWSSVGMTVERMNRDMIGVAALENKVTYAKELFPGDSFVIRSRFVWMRAKTAQFHHRLYVLKDDGAGLSEVPAATCTYTVACLDRDAHRATTWPDDIRDRVTPVLKPMEDAADA